jgi:hypothetical protein
MAHREREEYHRASGLLMTFYHGLNLLGTLCADDR